MIQLPLNFESHAQVDDMRAAILYAMNLIKQTDQDGSMSYLMRLDNLYWHLIDAQMDHQTRFKRVAELSNLQQRNDFPFE